MRERTFLYSVTLEGITIDDQSLPISAATLSILQHTNGYRFGGSNHPAAPNSLLCPKGCIQARDEPVPFCSSSLDARHMLQYDRVQHGEPAKRDLSFKNAVQVDLDP